MMHIEGVEIPDIPGLWHLVLPLIRRVTDKSGQDVQKIAAALMTGHAQLVIARDARGLAGVMVTELQTIAGKMVCNIWIVSGRDRKLWINDLDGLEQWAKEKGCSAIKCTDSRIGWRRVLEPRGYRVSRVTLEKEI